MLADALTKVVMIAGASAAALLDQHGADALAVATDGSVRMTSGLEGALCRAA